MSRGAALLAVLGLSFGCGGGDEPLVVAQTAVIGTTQTVDSFNELTSRKAFANTVLKRIYLPLAWIDVDRPGVPPSCRPALAESWEFDDSRRRLTFRLRETHWSDGRLVDAEDVRFTWQAQTSPETGWVGREAKRTIREVEVVDPRTVVFHFDRAYPYAEIDAVEGTILPAHVFGEIPFSDWSTYDWSTVDIASGPFRLTGYTPGEQIVLEKNDFYHDADAVALERVVIRTVGDGGALVQQLLAGDFDYAEGIPPANAATVAAREGFRVLALEEPKYVVLGWNHSRPPLDRAAVRRAMTLALDRASMARDLLHGFARVSVGPVLSTRWGVDPELEPWPFDPIAARRLLQQAGLEATADGSLRWQGRPFRLGLKVNAANPTWRAVALRIQEQLDRVGVGIDVEPLDFGAMMNAVAFQRDFDAYLGAWSFTGRVDLRANYASTTAPADGNVTGYASDEADRLLQEIAAAADFETMELPLRAIQRRLHEDQPFTFLFETQRVAAVGPGLEGVDPDSSADTLAFLVTARRVR